jgi:serine/threonine protein phosphatase 1
MQPTVLIGDVHGCLDELRQLWSLLNIKRDTRIIFLGDLIDRGPDSKGVLEFFEEQCLRFPDLHLLMGNHELKAISDYYRGDDNQVGLNERHIHLLETALPYLSFESGKFLAIHGGLYPAFLREYSALPAVAERDLWDSRLKQEIERFSFCRYVNSQGYPIPLGKQNAQDPFWADVYKGDFGTAFFGHQTFFGGPVRFPHAIALDQGCAFGGHLTAALIDDTAQISFVSVPARKTYSPYLNYGNQIANYARHQLAVPHLSFA